jgi:lincosamide nucleotidyltransferase A/C/D/E
MTAGDVLDFLALMDSLGIHVWIDGGWAVDACLGRETRLHEDLDIVIEARDLDTSVSALRDLGYSQAARNDTRLWNFAMRDESGREVDFHVIVLDANGNGIYGPPINGESYPVEALKGRGEIGGCVLDCIAPEWLVRFHSGYELDDTDRADVRALCQRFGISLPAEIGP